MAQLSLKSDISFLQKLAIGACGTRKVLNELEKQKFSPVVLERGSTGFKIWKSIKIKRVRVPDILCVDTGFRVESRAKTKLTISMSHSLSEQSRGWDFGLKENDYIAFVVCEKVSEKPIDWEADNLVQFIKVNSLRKAFDKKQVIEVRPKGVEEGFETRVTWPASVASSAGEVSNVEKEKLQYKKLSNNRTVTLKLIRKDIQLIPHVKVGDSFVKNTILASVVDILQTLPRTETVGVKFYIDLLSGTSISDRYTATKALSYIGNSDAVKPLLDRLKDKEEHIYIRLEAAATLIRLGQKEGFAFIETVLNKGYLEHRLEATIILSEIRNKHSLELLQNTLLDKSQHPEIRGGAAWALGELKESSSIQSLIKSFNSLEHTIKIEAARALNKLCDNYSETIIKSLKSADLEERPGIAWAISKDTHWDIEKLIGILSKDDLDLRQWLAFIMGSTEQSKIINEIERLKNQDNEVYFAVTVLWKIMSSWVYNLDLY